MEERESDKGMHVLCTFTGHDGDVESSVTLEIQGCEDVDRLYLKMKICQVCTCFPLSRFQAVHRKNTNSVDYLAHMVVYVPQWK